MSPPVGRDVSSIEMGCFHHWEGMSPPLGSDDSSIGKGCLPHWEGMAPPLGRDVSTIGKGPLHQFRFEFVVTDVVLKTKFC